MRRAALLILPAFLLAGCDSTKKFVDLDCSDIADTAVSISKGALVAIDDRTLTSRDDKRIVCHGTGTFHYTGEKLVRFQAYLDDDGDEIVRYDTDEYQAAQEAKEKQDEEREEQKAVQGLEQDYAQIQAQARSAMADAGS